MKVSHDILKNYLVTIYNGKMIFIFQDSSEFNLMKCYFKATDISRVIGHEGRNEESKNIMDILIRNDNYIGKTLGHALSEYLDKDSEYISVPLLSNDHSPVPLLSNDQPL
ncbi:MAG: hypothetical protein ACRCZI_03860, partial [Cetobacterium sp.]